MRMPALITKKSLLCIAVAIVVVLAILPFVLPYIGSSHSHVTTIP